MGAKVAPIRDRPRLSNPPFLMTSIGRGEVVRGIQESGNQTSPGQTQIGGLSKSTETTASRGVSAMIPALAQATCVASGGWDWIHFAGGS